jgi:ABC-type transporter Mla MlaB component
MSLGRRGRLVDMATRREVRFDVRGVAADMRSVDALCRLQLAAQRRGARIVLDNCSDELRALIALCGLDGVLRVEV